MNKIQFRALWKLRQPEKGRRGDDGKISAREEGDSATLGVMMCVHERQQEPCQFPGGTARSEKHARPGKDDDVNKQVRAGC
jgi:hypothetical protein